jgi:hypothetical protein
LRFLKYMLLSGVPFGLGMGAFFFLRSWDLNTSAILGLACGVLFGVMIAAFAMSAHRNMRSRSGVFDGERVIREGPANHFLRGEGRGGWLTLTPTRLVFRSHGANIQNLALDISLRDIEAARPALTMALIPNGLRITRRNGIEEFFVVSGRKAWARALSHAIASPGTDGAQSLSSP